MECPRCHAELDGRSRFCAACGYNVEELISAVQEDEQEEQPVAEDVETSSDPMPNPKMARRQPMSRCR